MTFRTLLTASLLSGLLPLAGHAQTAPATSRFYVGVGANLLTNVPFKDNGTVPKLAGPALTAGLQLTPHLAVQAGLSYHTQKDSFYYTYTTSTGPAISQGSTRYNYFLVPVLLRYSITAPTARVHFDALGGSTLMRATVNGSYSDSGSPLYDNQDYHDANTKAFLTVGPALRYTVSPRVELTANGLVSAALGKDYYQFSDRLFLNLAVGAHYTFGQY